MLLLCRCHLTRNINLREVVKTFLEEYKQCGSNKNQKSAVLDKVAAVLMNDQEPPTRFVRLEPKHKRWYVIEGHKELISQTFRDIAQDGYKSASTYKNLKRRKSTGDSGLLEVAPKLGDEMDKSLDNELDGSDVKQRLPPKKAAARKAASTSPIADKNKEDATSGDHSKAGENLSKKEQLERQIEELKKQLETLDDVNGGGNKDSTKASVKEEETETVVDGGSDKPTDYTDGAGDNGSETIPHPELVPI